ncbi:MAG TPA: Nif3-like dinuclear metal center hexameric protein [Elusimicrobiales bacterium]|nr:Nif3-like dinuclear metal center hexameric protein [Elusimicrobiales bacterium]
MARLKDIVAFSERELRSCSFRDASLNGLQVEGKPEVRGLALGVSASLEFLRRAAEAGADLAIVHHGLFWKGHPEPVTGPLKKKLALLLESGMSLAAWHLPLDAHPRLGNNAALLRLLGAGGLRPFGSYDGQAIGLSGTLRRPLSPAKAAALLAAGLGAKPLLFPYGPKKIRRVGAVSGGAARMFPQAAEAGLDLFVTGEAGEPSQESARELGVNFISAGHYNTEKEGVRNLGLLLGRRFRVKTFFVDVPNPV